jgi:cellulose synthase/poly-beta-1,6-N-acetylglucosamine synthase-like glycosyltransferase
LLEVLTAVPFLREIIVVSSGSTDRTDPIVRDRASVDPRVKLISQRARAGKAKAVNDLVDACRCDVLVFASADTLPTEKSVASLIRWFADPTVGTVSARPVPVNAKKGFGYVAHVMWSAHWRYLWNLASMGKLAHVSGEMCAFRSKLLTPIPDDIINDDAYLATVTKRAGLRTILDPSAIVYMKVPTNPVELIDQRRRVLAGHRQVIERTGRFPTVLATSWWIYLPASIRTFLGVFHEFGVKTWVWGLVLLLCELVAMVLTSRVFGHKTHLLWKPARSTKSLKADY